jgi:hypothetical protein
MSIVHIHITDAILKVLLSLMHFKVNSVNSGLDVEAQLADPHGGLDVEDQSAGLHGPLTLILGIFGYGYTCT